ncbi:MAG: NfeD family protein, partial [Anaerolineales bacterium]|nr:NfeD family protein [Anaerolineales bacterium]
AATHGALAITGTIILIIGLLVLFNTPQTPDIIRLSIPAAMAIGLLTAMFFIFIIGKALMAQRARTSTGIEGLIGQHGSVREPMISEKLKPPYSGMVLVAGELWRAEAAEELGKGEKVEVTAVNGFTLQVKQPDE